MNCVNNEKCAWFSYNPISTDCLLFESCSEIEENDLFFTGQKECEYSSIKSQFSILVIIQNSINYSPVIPIYFTNR